MANSACIAHVGQAARCSVFSLGPNNRQQFFASVDQGVFRLGAMTGDSSPARKKLADRMLSGSTTGSPRLIDSIAARNAS